MTLLEKYKALVKRKEKRRTIGIGVGPNKEQNINILSAITEFINDFKGQVCIFGTEEACDHLTTKKKLYAKNKGKIFFISSDNPEDKIFSDLKESKINAAVRGALPSHTFLENLKQRNQMEETYRLALLETNEGYDFFYGPVGIDECNSFKEKQIFIAYSFEEFQKIGIAPKISVLSGGRKGDTGRDQTVDKSLQMAENLVSYFQKENPDLEIFHDQILIEKAIERKSNLIIAPEGISGNLIYRTLVHLGGGKAYGAIYMGINDILVDTSRAGAQSEYYGALILALALLD
ncbi:MAG: methanogenesis marker protein Mmp4/MtxX [Promethearchaeia archaeon]